MLEDLSSDIGLKSRYCEFLIRRNSICLNEANDTLIVKNEDPS